MNNNLLFVSLKYIFNEYRQNKHNIFNLAKEKMRQQTLRTTLGLGWVALRDIVYFTVFIIFRYVMSGSGSIEGMNFILFLMMGMIPWNFMGECINGGVMAIKNSKSILLSIQFPIVILPTVEILAIFMKRFFTIFIMLIIIIGFGDIHNVTWWMLIYYFLSMFMLMIIWNLIFSSLVAISNDFEQLYKAFASIFFYTIPIIWSFEVLDAYPLIITIVKLNPFVYVIEGFRDACFSGTLPDFEYTFYFWSVCTVMLCIGSILQYKLRRHYVDLI